MVLGWTADGRVLAASHAGEESRSRRVAYAIGLDGGAPERLPYGYVSNLALAPPGAVLAATSGTVEVAWWKRLSWRHRHQAVARSSRRRRLPAPVRR